MSPAPSPMISLRFALVIFALIPLNLACMANHGFFSLTAVLAALAALVVALVACSHRTERSLRVPVWLGYAALLGVFVILVGDCLGFLKRRQDWARLLLLPGLVVMVIQAVRGRVRLPSLPMAVLGAAVVLLSGRAVVYTAGLAQASESMLAVISVAAAVGFLLMVISVLSDLGAASGRAPWFRTRLVLLFAAGATVRFASVLAWPIPPIDVFFWMQDAPRVLLEGNNPYVAQYMSLGEIAAYPPLPIVMSAPFTALGIDVRYANVICDMIAAGLLLLMATRAGRPLLGALAAGAFLNLPGTPFMLKNAWYEPMLAMLLAGGLLLAERGRWVGNLLLGIGLTGKQFGIPMFIALWRSGRWQLLIGTAVATVLVIVPFFLWSPKDFMNVVLHLHLAIGPDVQSLTLRSGAYHALGYTVPGWLAAVVTLLLVVWIAWQAPKQEGGTGLWMGTALLVFCLCYVKGYFNYFYLCSYLMLLGIAALSPEGKTVIVSQAAPIAGDAERVAA